MKRLLMSMILALAAVPVVAQTNPSAAFILSGVTWIPATTTASGGALDFPPPPVSLYCFNTGTQKWVPATSACLGGGGGGGVTGSGTIGSIPLWTGTTALGNSHLTDNGTYVTSLLPFVSGTTSHGAQVNLQGTGTSSNGTLVHTGSGLNDATITGTYNCSVPTSNPYEIYMDSVGATDQFGADNSQVEIDNMPITGSAQYLFCGLYVTFGHTTGHTLDDDWTATASMTQTLTLQEGYNFASGAKSYTLNADGSIASQFFNVVGQLGNVGVGYGALSNPSATLTGEHNTALGSGALYNTTSGVHNTAVGTQALLQNSTGNYNTALGEVALQPLTSGDLNTALGDGAMAFLQTGSSNTCVGANCMFRVPSGSQNVTLGKNAGDLTTPYSNTLVINNLSEQGQTGTDSAFALIYGKFSGTAGSLTGQSLRVNGAFSVAGGTITGVLASTTTATTQSQLDGSTKVATTAYTDLAVSNAVAGVNPAVAVLAASTANVVGTYTQIGGGIGDTFTVTATGAFSLDGIAINTIGQRVLLKNQATASQNGVYFASVVGASLVSPVFTRALDYDTPSDVNNTGSIPVQSGTVNTTTSWLLTSQVTSIGSAGSALTYAQFSIAPSTLVSASAPGAGIARFAGGTQVVTSAELSGDVTTSGSNVATVVQVEGAAIPVSASYLATNASKQLVAAIAPAWFNLTPTVTVSGCSVSSGACSVSGTTTTAITFSVIPGTYNRLQLVFWGQGSALANVQLTYNSDTGAHYYVNGTLQNGTSAPAADNSATSAANCVVGNMTTGVVSTFETDIPFYANTSFGKGEISHGSAVGDVTTAASNYWTGTGCGWNQTTAVTSVTLTASTGHFVAGTEFMILGQN